jgi:hypothetical protein
MLVDISGSRNPARMERRHKAEIASAPASSAINQFVPKQRFDAHFRRSTGIIHIWLPPPAVTPLMVIRVPIDLLSASWEY